MRYLGNYILHYNNFKKKYANLKKLWMRAIFVTLTLQIKNKRCIFLRPWIYPGVITGTSKLQTTKSNRIEVHQNANTSQVKLFQMCMHQATRRSVSQQEKNNPHILKSLRVEYKQNKRKPTHEPINQSSEWPFMQADRQMIYSADRHSCMWLLL